MPRVEVRLFGHLRRSLPSAGGASTMMELPEGSTVGALLDRLGIAPEEFKVLLVNGTHCDRSRILKEGDRLGVFPPVAGG